jgi:Anti-sigma factor NepR
LQVGTNYLTVRSHPDMLRIHQMSDMPKKPPIDLKGRGAKQSQKETRAIATGLKSLYRTVVEEPIPDDLLNLLDSLDDQD